MISQFLLKGIDNFFNDKVDIKNNKSIFSKDTIKRDLSTVIRAKRDISQSRLGGHEGTASKSRLLLHLEEEKEDKFQGVIKRNTEMQKSRSSIKVGYKPNPSISQIKNIERQSLVNKYKENITQPSQTYAPYMPSKDHAQREKQCRLPIKNYKYQF